MKKDQLTHNVYKQVLDRLERRKKLAEAAFAFTGSRNVETERFFQEQDIGGTCPQPRGKHNFTCGSSYSEECQDSTYSCPPPHDGFKCTSETKTYNDCSGNDSHQCSQSASPSFSCEQGGDTADYFDCRTFTCGQAGGQEESFNCDSTVDYICGGEEYVCIENFNCTAGHGFSCGHDHDCSDKFTCSGGEVQGCGTASAPKAVGCADERVDSFSSRSGRDSNNDPGDFLCGGTGTEADEFDCKADFDCDAASDFSCVETSDFTCNDFECNSTSTTGSGEDKKTVNSFQCFSSFTCSSSDSFDCAQDDSEFECANYTCSYAECTSDTEKECKSEYRCLSAHECAAPGFECAQGSTSGSMFRCTDSSPPFTYPPGPFG